MFKPLAAFSVSLAALIVGLTVWTPGSLAQSRSFLTKLQQGEVSTDPLGSSIPIPWQQIQTVQARAQQQNRPQTVFERTPLLRSPDGRFAVYSRLLIQAKPQVTDTSVSSVLFLQDLQTQQLQAIAASTPREGLSSNGQAGTVVGFGVLVPIAWSARGDRVLCRDFQGGNATDFISDYALIWDQQQRRTYTLAPNRINYSNAILLGWSRQHPERALFKAGLLGETNWPQWTVQLNGSTAPAPQDEPLKPAS
ncbi:hypothetical protein [Leptolyngbya sp. FACHB-261]|uniref:hypothetical protein n=1 Tax=Leptolyngbya sp. FACHB-261 TaxID=2692806 RepID=UPI00168A24FF|nr:hypothetical protein [Leptolyngbya sp. FACHB-261]MBD2102374.1 hypothetical protein [Leptolyngbya sp. FACHB-261]